MGAIFAAMAAHPDATQVLQEGTRALEKHCPRAVASIARLCGDLIAVLPPVVWSSGPDLGGMLHARPLAGRGAGRGVVGRGPYDTVVVAACCSKVHLDVEELKSNGWAPRGATKRIDELT